LFRNNANDEPCLIFAIAEHKVELPGGNAASQSDVWAVVKTSLGMVSLTVEAKANEAFGDHSVEEFLIAGKTKQSRANREQRLEYLRRFLPPSDHYGAVRYQIFHRCAASVIEAARLRLSRAAFIVQSFKAPAESFQDYLVFCQALKVPAERGSMAATSVDDISLSIGWADCPLATDQEIAATV
jgi:hypothetical protein